MRSGRMLLAGAAAGVGVFLLLALTRGPAASARAGAPAPSRLLFAASVVSGSSLHPRPEPQPPDIYSLSASDRRLAQLTFSGGADPLPSPDGRQVAFARDRDLWVMSANGLRQRLVARNAVGAAWAPDSRTLAYIRPGSNGIRAVRADGRGDRLLVAGDAHAPTWSRDGRSLAFLRVRTNATTRYTLAVVRVRKERLLGSASDDRPSWSSDGRWLAYTSAAGGVVIVNPDGSGARVVDSGPAAHAAWSPRGRRLAYLRDSAIVLFDQATGKRRTLVPAPFWPKIDAFAWSPDGRELAYEAFNSESELTQISTVSLHGQISRLGGYPLTTGLVWTTPPARLRYQAPELGPVAAANELRFRVPVEELSADGDGVAYRTCGAIGVWKPASDMVTVVRSDLPLCNFQDNWLQFYSLALAGDHVGWGVVEGGNSQTSSLTAATVAADPSTTILAGGPGETNGDPRGTARVGYLLGAGPLLVFSSWAYCDEVGNNSCSQLPAAQRPLVSQTLWRFRDPSWPRTCPGTTAATTSARCQQVRVEPGPLRPLDADAGRIVASGDNATVVLDADGDQLLSIPVATTAAQLAGSDLVVLVPGALRDYDATTGALLHSWPLPDVSLGGFCGEPMWECGSPRLRLEGAARGMVVYMLDGKLHLLRLSDEADTVVADATGAQLDDSGLFYAYQTTGIWPGRIRFVPFDQLPLR
jgi:Tol biopolymer transport system component